MKTSAPDRMKLFIHTNYFRGDTNRPTMTSSLLFYSEEAPAPPPLRLNVLSLPPPLTCPPVKCSAGPPRHSLVSRVVVPSSLVTGPQPTAVQERRWSLYLLRGSRSRRIHVVASGLLTSTVCRGPASSVSLTRWRNGSHIHKRSKCHEQMCVLAAHTGYSEKGEEETVVCQKDDLSRTKCFAVEGLGTIDIYIYMFSLGCGMWEILFPGVKGCVSLSESKRHKRRSPPYLENLLDSIPHS